MARALFRLPLAARSIARKGLRWSHPRQCQWLKKSCASIFATISANRGSRRRGYCRAALCHSLATIADAGRLLWENLIHLDHRLRDLAGTRSSVRRADVGRDSAQGAHLHPLAHSVTEPFLVACLIASIRRLRRHGERHTTVLVPAGPGYGCHNTRANFPCRGARK